MREIPGPGDPEQPQEQQQPKNEANTAAVPENINRKTQDEPFMKDYPDPDHEWF